MSAVATSTSSTTARGWDGLRYGAPGFPLAFVALPLYVALPNHYAAEFGVPLAALGAVLLAARLLDALIDPWIGRWADALLDRSAHAAWLAMAGAAVVLALGFRGLFFPLVSTGTAALLAWCGILLVVTYLAYSVISVIHQAWGARLGGDEPARATVVAWREGLALCGVLVASVLPSMAGLQTSTVVFAIALCLALALMRQAPAPRRLALFPSRSLRLPFSTPAFPRLLAVYLLNGIASAVPATLVLFFIRDRLQATAYEPLFLASYFAAAAVSVPLWVRLVARLGLARSWLAGMALSVLVFAWAAALSAGDVAAYTAICVMSGIALGADLALPAALLAGVVQQAGHAGRAEGAYFGWWNFATKLNLALAAGIALPVLQLFGYAPGTTSAPALQALTAAYCVLPCVMKLIAAALLWRYWIKESR
ncbi:MFS transporter [Piscinibacter sp. HJYY11]|uniref:MFS transporter n=1 Tax=Piscinibacter sp. HJYY11 TaxID=2801333 RepID=UPI002872C8B6|nr:MFS transporter [Piscinibacter sp. HJYY11]